MQSQAEPTKEDRVNTKGGVAPDGDKAADAIDGAAPQEGLTSEDKAFKEAKKEREDELHDEALEESFPASDPPSAKHIT